MLVFYFFFLFVRNCLPIAGRNSHFHQLSFCARRCLLLAHSLQLLCVAAAKCHSTLIIPLLQLKHFSSFSNTGNTMVCACAVCVTPVEESISHLPCCGRGRGCGLMMWLSLLWQPTTLTNCLKYNLSQNSLAHLYTHTQIHTHAQNRGRGKMELRKKLCYQEFIF